MAPRRTSRRPSRLVGAVLIVAAVALLAAVARTGTATDAGSLVLRAVTALVIGAILIRFVRRALRSMVEPPPTPPDTVEATTTEVVYECGVCGTRVRLEVASTGKAPRHCGEEMEPSIG